MADEIDTLRFPAKLDTAAIRDRLCEIRETARQAGLDDVAALLNDVETSPVAGIGKAVIGAIGLIEGKAEHLFLTKQLQIVAMNLKNLRRSPTPPAQ